MARITVSKLEETTHEEEMDIICCDDVGHQIDLNFTVVDADHSCLPDTGAYFPAGQGKWGGSKVTSNHVYGRNLMDFGIHMGKHPWIETVWVNGGTIGTLDPTKPNLVNTISGASINLSVDGWLNGAVGHNSLSQQSGLGMQLDNFACSTCVDNASGMNFTIGDYADDNGNVNGSNFSQQAAPDEYLILHNVNPSLHVPPNTCSDLYPSCGSDTSCTVCEISAGTPNINNRVCRAPDGSAACTNPDGRCKKCDTGEIFQYVAEAKEAQ